MGRGKEGRESPYLDRLRRDANDIERFHFCVRKRQPHGATDRVCGDERDEEKRNRDSRKRRDLVTREPEGAREETDCSDTEADAEQRDLLEMMRRQSCVHAGACCAYKYNGVAGDTIHVAFASPYADVLLDSLGSSSGAGSRPSSAGNRKIRTGHAARCATPSETLQSAGRPRSPPLPTISRSASRLASRRAGTGSRASSSARTGRDGSNCSPRVRQCAAFWWLCGA